MFFSKPSRKVAGVSEKGLGLDKNRGGTPLA